MDVFDLEKKFPELENVKFNGISGWPLLRIIVGYEMARKNFKSIEEKKRGVLKRFINLLNSFFGWGKFMIQQKKFDYVIFSNNLEKRAYNSLYYDRLFHSTITHLDNKNVLLVNYCEGDVEKIKHSYYANIINGDLFNYLGIVFSRFVRLNITERDKDLIAQMLKEADILFDYEKYFKIFIVNVSLYGRLFRKVKPKFVLNGCYTYFSQIYCAKLAGIPTIEFQHGLINSNHRGYRTLLRYNREFTSDYLFAFGEQSVFDLDESIYKRDQVRIVGYSYFEMLQQGFFNPVNIDKKNFDTVICAPIDNVVEKETVNIIVNIAQSLKNTLFIINPRSKITDESASRVRERHNVIVSYEPFQVLIQQCNYNLTIYSTCAFESIYFGVPNLLFNYEGYSRKILGELLDEKKFSYYFETEQELIDFIKKDYGFEKNYVMPAGKKFYSDNHSLRMEKAFSSIV